ncbi:MAG: hypothetical protein ACLKAK_06865 [Alkaliphilus sp.]
MYYSKKIYIEKENIGNIHNRLIAWEYQSVLNKGKSRVYKFPINEIEIDNSIWRNYNILRDFYIKVRVTREKSGIAIIISVVPKINSITFMVFAIGLLIISFLIEMIVMNEHYHMLTRGLFVPVVFSGLIYNYLRIKKIFKVKINYLINKL